MEFYGYVRNDGSIGVRNHVLALSTVLCTGPIPERIADNVEGVVPIRHPWCFPTGETRIVLQGVVRNPNVAGAVIMGLGCEGYDESDLLKDLKSVDKPKIAFNIRDEGGTSKLLSKGIQTTREMVKDASTLKRQAVDIKHLRVGIKCGGSGATSGLAANPAVGKMADMLVDLGATVIFSEPIEMLGAEDFLARRAVNEEVADKIREIIGSALVYYREKRPSIGSMIGERMISPGNVRAGLTTATEKALGAVLKGGTAPIQGVLKYGEAPEKNGLYIMDGTGIMFGDVATLIGFVAADCQITIFTTDRGSVVGTPIAPVLKVCGNSDTFDKMEDNLDINAGEIIRGNKRIDETGEEIFKEIIEVASGKLTKSEIHKCWEFDYIRSL
jgi:altronate dehydratase large subunit